MIGNRYNYRHQFTHAAVLQHNSFSNFVNHAAVNKKVETFTFELYRPYV